MLYAHEATLEPNVGGKIKLTTLKEKHPEWKMDRDYTNDGIILEFIPNKKLSYTWAFKDLPEFPETTVIWELEEIGPNKTKVALTHTGFTGEEKGLTSIQNHEEGWADGLKQLAKYCEKKETK